MSIIASLLDKIKSKRVERFSSIAEKYDHIVGELAVGKEADVDDLAGLLDELDKSESDLQQDIDNKQRRISAAAELQRLAAIAKEIPPIEQQIERLVAEIEAFVAPRKQKLTELRESLKYKRLDADRVGYVQDELQTVGIPLSILARKQALDQRQLALSEKIDRHHRATERPQADLSAYRSRLVTAKEKAAKAISDFERREASDEITRITAHVDRLERELAPWVRLAEEIQAEQKNLADEQDAIRRELLKP